VRPAPWLAPVVLVAGCGGDGESATPPAPAPPPAVFATTAARIATGMPALEAAFRIVERNPDEAYFAGPASEAEIERAEKLLGVEFPPTYRRFLATLGAGDAFAEEFYGIVPGGDLEEAAVPNAIGTALADRRGGFVRDDLLMVYDLGEGTYFGIDFSATTPGGEHPVVAWHGVPEAGTEVVAPDFGTFFYETLRDASG
jgi:hypothetical protein